MKKPVLVAVVSVLFCAFGAIGRDLPAVIVTPDNQTEHEIVVNVTTVPKGQPFEGLYLISVSAPATFDARLGRICLVGHAGTNIMFKVVVATSLDNGRISGQFCLSTDQLNNTGCVVQYVEEEEVTWAYSVKLGDFVKRAESGHNKGTQTIGNPKPQMRSGSIGLTIKGEQGNASL